MSGGSAFSQEPKIPCDSTYVWFTDAEAQHLDQWIVDAHATKRQILSVIIAQTNAANNWRTKATECDTVLAQARLRLALLNDAWIECGDESRAKDRKIAALKPWKVGGIAGLVLLLSSIILQNTHP